MNTRTTKMNSIKWNLVVLVAAAVLLVGIGVPASSSGISIQKVNAQGANKTNATTGYFTSGPNITGSIAMGPTIAKAIASQVHVSLANASTTAEKAVGANAHAFPLPWCYIDPGNGEVLFSSVTSMGTMMGGNGGMMK